MINQEISGQSLNANSRPSASLRILDIDGFRAIAMLVVFCYHTWQGCGAPQWKFGGLTFDFSHGPNFVDLFIVLSGFCLFMPLTNPQKLRNWDIKNYLYRRARRILPAYYAALLYAILLPQALVVLMHLLGKEAKPQVWPGTWDIVSHLLFIQNFATDTWSSINGSLWTMSLEVQLYLAFPLVIWAIKRFGLKALGGVIALSLVFRVISDWGLSSLSDAQRFLWQISFVGRWLEFALGALVAWFVVQRLNSKRRLTVGQGTLGIGLAAVFYFLAQVPTIQHLPAGREIFLSLAFALTIGCVCLSNTPLASVVRNKPITKLGLISYSFYLIHQPTVYYATEMAEKVLHIPEGGKELAMMLPASFCLCLGLSLPFFHFFEKPFLKAPKKKEVVQPVTVDNAV